MPCSYRRSYFMIIFFAFPINPKSTNDLNKRKKWGRVWRNNTRANKGIKLATMVAQAAPLIPILGMRNQLRRKLKKKLGICIKKLILVRFSAMRYLHWRTRCNELRLKKKCDEEERIDIPQMNTDSELQTFDDKLEDIDFRKAAVSLWFNCNMKIF